MTSTARFCWTRTYEPGRNLIAAVSNVWGAAAVSSFAYTNDALGRRTLRVDTAQGLPVTNVFAYNQRSEVTNAAMGGTAYSYSFDDIGNRKQASVGASLSTYTANALNQYTAVSDTGQDVAVAYDLDGNMLTNGVWAYTWDAENRMVSAVSDGAVVVSNAYDYLSRRVRKEVYAWDTQLTAYRLQFTAHYVWDNWNIAAEIVVDASVDSTNVHFYTWGLDLSGTVQGAGGVGGLLADTVLPAADSLLPTAYFSCYDANGNVTDYVDASGNLRARYAYSAFGETTLQSGDMAGTFTHRFSTKPFDTETGVSKYQLRDYLPGLGRWASRDPIGEAGGENLSCLLNNNSVGYVDSLGLKDCCGPDVSLAVENTMIKIEDTFKAWTDSEKQEACENLYNPQHSSGSWDIPELRQGVFYKGLCGTGKCKRTVMYGGRCVYSSGLNYMMFGKANQLCRRNRKRFSRDKYWFGGFYPVTWSLFDVQVAVAYQKYYSYGWQQRDLRKGFGGAASEAFAFALVGFSDNTNFDVSSAIKVPLPALFVLATKIDSASKCASTSGVKVYERSFSVTWWPHKISPVLE